MKFETLVVGPFDVNCYIIWSESDNIGVIVDPGDEDERIIDCLDKNKIIPQAILLTHGHGDHIAGVEPLKDKYEMALAYYRDKGLTRRETEVVSLTIRGVSNPEICDQLSISKATLRTHLNNVYRKFRDLGEVPAFMPANRIVG